MMPGMMRLWTGRIIGSWIVLFLVVDAVMKILKTSASIEGTVRLGYPERLVMAIGLAELVCVAAYVFPRTSILGAILLTGYLGGAVMTHLRVGDPLASHALFPTYMGALLWLGLYLREPRLRALVPFRS